MSYIIAVDTGGTFTDLVAFDTERRKFLSTKSLTTYDDFVRGVAECIRKTGVPMERVSSFKFGTTLVINAFIQRNGARVALVTTRGFRDVLEMGRGNRPLPYDLRYKRHDPLVPRDWRLEVSERVAADGTVLEPLDMEQLEAVVQQIALESPPIEAVAVSFLNSYRNDVHEKQAADFIRTRLPNHYITSGAELSREWYEFERTSTAAANAYVGPKVQSYIRELDSWLKVRAQSSSLFLMASNGGIYSAHRARREPLALIESGPVGGCIGAATYAAKLGLDKVIAFDMGGTTAKCCVVSGGRFQIESPYYVGGADYGFPIQANVLGIVEVGAGGGSIAAVDPQGRVSVGPKSAGSDPGPACYARGGLHPTVTDANVVLGRIGEQLVGGEMQLDADAARQAVMKYIGVPLGFEDDAHLDRVAQGVLDIATFVMGEAIKQVTMVKGADPREFTLLVYGGCGPVHASDLARTLGIRRVVIPPHPGAFAAFGMLMAKPRIDLKRVFVGPLLPATMSDLRAELEAMSQQCGQALEAEFQQSAFESEWQMDLQYKGQAHTLRIPISRGSTCPDILDLFHAAYQQRYGHANLQSAVDVVSITVTATAVMDIPELVPVASSAQIREPRTRSVYFGNSGRCVGTPVYDRDTLRPGIRLRGPLIVEEFGTSTVVGPSDHLRVGEFGELNIGTTDGV